jgi:hypothetical protein
MVYRLSMAVDSNIAFEIEEAVFDDLLDLWEKMGGEKPWIINAVRASVAASLHGEPVRALVRGLNGQVIEDADNTQTQSSASGNGASNGRGASTATGRGDAAGGSRTAPPSDPWSTDRDEYPGEASVAR